MPQRLDSLTGVRIFAAALVFGFHADHYGPGGEMAAFSTGMVGVSLFYILSGFVMAWTAQPDDTARAFYRRRFARVYPAYIAAWLISLVLAISDGSLAGVDFIPPTLLQSWVPNDTVYFAGNAVFWSLSVEAFFYLTFPVIHRGLSRMDQRGLILIGAGTLVTVFAIGATFTVIPTPNTQFMSWFIVVFPLARLPEFVLGIVLGMTVRAGWRSPIPLSMAVLLTIGGIWLAENVPYPFSRVGATIIPFAILVVTLATSDLRSTASIFRWRWIVQLGIWSYAFYLLHAMVIDVVFRVARRAGLYSDTSSGLEVYLPTAAAAILSVVSAWLLHALVEATLRFSNNAWELTPPRP
ncbi:MAG: acyltransferase, partial [Rhodoglobus sp.]|nr:acyltransferase [Rhodoglobus sp.]